MAEASIRREVIVAVDGKDDYSWQVVEWALKMIIRPDDLLCVVQIVPCKPQHVEVLHGKISLMPTVAAPALIPAHTLP